MKRKIVMMAAMVLSIGCMAVPVAASENLAVPAEIAAEASVTSPYCPTCGKLVYRFVNNYIIHAEYFSESVGQKT